MTDPQSASPSGDPQAAGEAADAEPLRPTFDALPLSREIRETLAEIGYTHPTPVQLAVWEPATRGRDAVVQARTGTGKTAAFGLPIVDHLVKRSIAQIQVLALCPTRELALQVAAEIERLGRRKGIKVVAIYGGAPMQRQVDAIAAGAQVVIGTPGRVLDHLRRGTLVAKHIKLLVLDECDEMLSMGFERELSAILAELPAERQTLLFSATVPTDIERMAKSKLRSPEFVTLSGDAVGALSIQHYVYLVTGDKPGALMRVIEADNPESAIIFCNTRDETESLAAALKRQGYDAEWLNGDLPQSDREKVMGATREGRLRFLVATDVAARGIDISHLTHVINYDFPQDPEGYVHRTGRTGRAGRTGTAISLITPQDVGPLYILRLTYKIRPLERQIPTEGELKTRAEADLVAMLAEAFLPRGTHPDDLALARRLLTHDQAEIIVAGLLRDHLGARPTAQEEASAARRAKPPARSPGATRRREPEQGPRADGVELLSPDTERSRERALQEDERRLLVLSGPALGPAASAAPSPAEPLPEAPSSPDRRRARSEPERTRRRSEARVRDDVPPSAEPLTRPEPLMQVVAPPMSDMPRRPAGAAASRRAQAAAAPPQPAAAQPRPPQPPVAAPRVTGHRHADFTTWQPPEEEGDDEPILGEAAHPPATGAAPAHGAARDADESDPAALAAAGGTEDGEFVEVYVNVGRRDGARASDFQRLLVDRAEVQRGDVRRIRVRERNAFVSVRRAELARAVEALNGAVIAGKEAHAEQARERMSSAGDTAEDAAGTSEAS